MANVKHSEPGVWDEEEKCPLGIDVQATSGYREGTDQCALDDFELTRLTHEGLDISHITSGLPRSSRLGYINMSSMFCLLKCLI